MFFYKQLSPNIHALHLDVPNSEFLVTWEKAILSKNKDIDHLVSILRPYVLHWVALLTKTKPPDIQLVTLYQYLEASDKLDNLQIWLDSVDNLESELLFVLIETISKFKFFPKEASGIKAEYVFALAFIRRLKLHLFKASGHHFEILEAHYEDDYPDYFIIKNITSNPWDAYLFLLIASGFNSVEIAEICKIPRETFYYEEQNIWHQLKKAWQRQAA